MISLGLQAVCINDNLIILRSTTGNQHKLQRCDLRDCGTGATSIIKYEDLLPDTDNELVTGIAASDTTVFLVTGLFSKMSFYNVTTIFSSTI